MPDPFDIVVIGSGPAGEKAALEAAHLGAKVAVVEQYKDPGGAGIISGTLPSKSLRETVRYLEQLHHSEVHGLRTQMQEGLTMEQLMFRKRRVTQKRVDCIYDAYAEAGVTYLNGHARLLNPHLVEVALNQGKTTTLNAQKIIICVGTRPYHPPGVEFDGKHILDSDSLLDLDIIPRSLAVYGGGVIGSEYAAIFAKLGVQVTLIDPRGTLLNFLDEEISAELHRIFIASGIRLLLGEEYQRIFVQAGQAVVELKSGIQVQADALLYANGRQGLAGDLGLEQIGVKVNHKSQLEVNDQFQTNLPHIYAAGDVIGPPALVSTSNHEGRLAARHAVTGEAVHRISHPIPSAVYTLPEVGMIGPSSQELRAKGIPFQTGICRFGDLARGLMTGEVEGFLKLLFDPQTRQVLAVHIIGPQAAELIHLGQAVMRLGGGIDYFLDEVMNFPTLTAAYKVAAMNGVDAQGHLCHRL